VGPSLLADTLERFAGEEYGAPLLVCAAASAEVIREAHPDVAALVETSPSGTAAAVLAAALHLGRDRTMLVVPADHAIGDPAPLHDAVRRGLPVAVAGSIVLFGLTARHADTGFGWIVPTDPVALGVRRVARFEEKPTAARAAELLGARALWNGGMFLLRASTALDVAHELGVLPDSARGSFDERVVERAPSVAVVPVDLDWSDLGTWDTLRARRGVHGRHALFPGEAAPAGPIRILDGAVVKGRAGPAGAIVETITSSTE
jgi:mannose-1-phosphate guanylyltransferase/mannose-1-phosphate guanylyltransferase/mannose-6-phosphate isomerase